MIEVRAQHPVGTNRDPDPVIGSFAESEWCELVQLARRYGFDPPSVETHFPRPYDRPVELDADASRDLYEAISAVHNDEAVPYATTGEESTETSGSGTVRLPGEEPEEAAIIREAPDEHPDLHVGKVQVKRLLSCAQIGAGHGGLQIRRVRDREE